MKIDDYDFNDWVELAIVSAVTWGFFCILIVLSCLTVQVVKSVLP